METDRLSKGYRLIVFAVVFFVVAFVFAIFVIPVRFPHFLQEGDMGGGGGVSEHHNTAKKISEHRITARKVNETPSPQLISAMISLSTLKIMLLYHNNFPH